MTVAVVIPYRGGCRWRERALTWTFDRYRAMFNEIVFGVHEDGPFNRSAAILDGAAQTTADVLVIADGDCWSDGITDAVETVEQGRAWAVPHLMLRRLNRDATERVLAGADPQYETGLEERPYKGHEAGTLLVIRRTVLFDIPPDIRFEAWGQEDDAWALALRTLEAAPWRGSAPCWHLWHPPQPRLTRRIGSRENQRLYRRYVAANHQPDAMRKLIEEVRRGPDEADDARSSDHAARHR